MEGLAKIMRCEVCGGAELHDALDLGRHPMCDDLVPVGDGRVTTTYPVSISFCRDCRTAHQNYQIPKATLFPESYHYRARHTADVLDGMRALVESAALQAGDLNGLKVLDIGCNDGSLLSAFAAKGAITFGIEPTGAAADAKVAGHRVYQEFLSPELAAAFVRDHGQPDIITFTNVFAHIEDLSSVLRAVRTLLSANTLLIIENHYLGAVLDRYQFDTFYHEHPRTYSLTSFLFIARSLGVSIVSCEFPARYGGNIRIMAREVANADAVEEAETARHLAREEAFEARLLGMARRIPLWQQAKRAVLDAAVAQHGPLPAKAFPGRAAILVKLLDLDQGAISAAYEKPGSMKLGHYVPGTRIPIVSDDDFHQRPNEAAPVVNFAWHISNEIEGYMRKRGFRGPIIDIFSPDEFDRLG